MTADVRVARVVSAPAEPTWRVLTDWERQGEWMPATRVRASNGHQVGGRIEAWTGLGPVGFLDSMTITVWDSPRRCEVMHTGWLVRGPGVFAVEPLTADTCRVVWEEHLDLPLGAAGRMGWALVRPLARAGLAFALRRLAGVVTSPSK
ncbi:MAG TPA: SRPBCC family protein [Jiangellaceae bacterium]|nr:SRPBCC family protein [Jiangellaceae bacterium]